MYHINRSYRFYPKLLQRTTADFFSQRAGDIIPIILTGESTFHTQYCVLKLQTQTGLEEYNRIKAVLERHTKIESL